jgi:hypothetical protein
LIAELGFSIDAARLDVSPSSRAFCLRTHNSELITIENLKFPVIPVLILGTRNGIGEKIAI